MANYLNLVKTTHRPFLLLAPFVYNAGSADALALSLLTFVRTLFQALIGFALEIRALFEIGNT